MLFNMICEKPWSVRGLDKRTQAIVFMAGARHMKLLCALNPTALEGLLVDGRPVWHSIPGRESRSLTGGIKILISCSKWDQDNRPRFQISTCLHSLQWHPSLYSSIAKPEKLNVWCCAPLNLWELNIVAVMCIHWAIHWRINWFFHA